MPANSPLRQPAWALQPPAWALRRIEEFPLAIAETLRGGKVFYGPDDPSPFKHLTAPLTGPDVPPPGPEDPIAVPGALEPWPTEEAYIRAERFRRERRLTEIEANRVVVEWAGVPFVCPRKGCRRARRCRSANVVCHHETFPFLKEQVYPVVMKAIRERPIDYSGDGNVEEETS